MPPTLHNLSLGTFNQKENKVFNELKMMMKSNAMHEVNNEEATSALLNYFAELGVSDETVQVDYTFIEQLLISAGLFSCLSVCLSV